MKKREIRAIIFDIGGVLANLKAPIKNYKGKKHMAGVHLTIAKELGVSLDQWFDSIDSIYARSMEGKITKQKTLTLISKNNNTSPEKLEKITSNAYKKNFKENIELYNFAIRLKKRGYKIAILSDQWALSRDIFVPKKYRKNFEVLVISCDVGIRKPSPASYKLVLKKLKIKSNRAIFIDNQKWNTDAAEKLGIPSILFKNNKQTINSLKKLGVSL